MCSFIGGKRAVWVVVGIMEQTALRLLKRLKASSASRERVTSLLLLLLAINPKSDCHALIKWLSQSCSEIEARKLIKTILTTHRGPFSFVLNPSIGWMIVIYDENSKSNDFEEIMKVPYLPVTCSDSKPLSSSIETTNHINADIRVGDEIKLTSLPKMWFFVHEIRPQSNSVMLIAVDETKKSRLKGREYKEIYCLSLIGCTVKRRTAVMCEDHYPNSCFCQRITDAPIIFKFPQPDPQTALEALASIVDDECQTFGLFGQEIDEFGSDHVIKMQKASFVETWLEKKKNLVSARKYLHHIHSTLSLSRYILTILLEVK